MPRRDVSSFSFDPIVKTVSMEASGNRQHLDKLMSDMDVTDSGAGGTLRPFSSFLLVAMKLHLV